MTQPRLIQGEDGGLYVAAEDAVTDPDDSDYVGGGVRLGTAKTVTVDGLEVEVREIVTAAAGGSFGAAQDVPEPFRKPKDRAEALKQGFDLWKYDPLGGAIVNLVSYFTFGRGLRIQASDPVAEKVLRKFWAKNALDRKSKTLCEEGVAFGENFVKLVVHREDVEHPNNPKRKLWRKGQVEIVPIAPEIVTRVDHNPVNVDDVNEYHLTYKGEEKGGRREVVEEKLAPLDKFDPDEHDAAILHLKFNAASNELFGLSDLLRIKEWLDNYKDFLRDSVLINRLYRSPCYDITIKDADEKEIRRAIRRYEGWTIGSNPVHNDRETWKVLEFAGANVSQEASRRALLLIVAAGSGLPEHYFADGSSSNKATAKAMELPSIKKFEDRQESYRWFWERVFRFVLDMADQLGDVGGLEPKTDFEGDSTWQVQAKFPPILVDRDKEIAEANRMAIEDGYMSRQTAAARAGLDFEQERGIGLDGSTGSASQQSKGPGLGGDSTTSE